MPNIKKIVIIGGGFAGVWSALAAMRHCHLLNKKCEITLVNKDPYHNLRPRFYETDLTPTRIALDKILTPFGIKLILGEVIQIDLAQQKIQIKSSEKEFIEYDRLILAAGSQLNIPNIPGLKEYSFNVDTYDEALRLNTHLLSLPQKPKPGRYQAVIIGGGFTGIEVATELISRLKNIATDPSEVNVIIVDRHDIGHTLGEAPRQVALKALESLGIKTLPNVQVKAIKKDHIILHNDHIIDTQTLIWTAGMRANPLTAFFPVALDPFGRLTVDAQLRITGVKNCFAAGDVALAMTDINRPSLFMCQHAIPQGRYAGHNAVASLLQAPLLSYVQKTFVSIIDLGAFGALYAEGWDLQLKKQGPDAKAIKHFVNHQRIYPITNGDMATLMDAAEPLFKAMTF